MSVKKYIRNNIYSWHRITSLIVALPILLWSVSGFLHPVMNSFGPDVKNEVLPVAAIDTSEIHITLGRALQQNNIGALHRFRIIKMDSTYYYQIQQAQTDSLTYLSCVDGKILKDGDRRYASYLAQRYLSEPILTEQSNGSHEHSVEAALAAPAGHSMHANINGLLMMFRTAKIYRETKITHVELIRRFNTEYKNLNLLLPVYRVNFDRPDQIRLYIETSTDRLAAAIDNKKAWFIRFFGLAHTWSFLDRIEPVKNIVLGTFSLICFITSLLGFYVYNMMSKKKASAASKYWHRTLGNVFVITTALYGFSGAWHSFYRLSENTGKEIIADRSVVSASEFDVPIPELVKHLSSNEKLTNVSVVKMNGESYWQLFVSAGKEKRRRYIDTKTAKELPEGDIKYGCYLACQFSNKPHHSITHSKCLNEFTGQYGMMNKRLPVIEVGFDEVGNYYVETSTGQLSAIIGPFGKAEQFSFSNLHMHHYWEHWVGEKGKAVQKTVLIATTLGLLLLALTGCLMYYRKKQKLLKRSAQMI